MLPALALETDQATVAPTVFPQASFAKAVKACVLPAAMLGVAGVSTMVLSAPAPTLRSAEAVLVTLLTVALTVTAPVTVPVPQATVSVPF
jgi:hypothetical protein